MRGPPDPRAGRQTSGDPAREIGASEAAALPARLAETVGALRARTPLVPRIGVVLGSGLGGVADRVAIGGPPGAGAAGAAFDTAPLPHWPRPTVPGHAGRVVLGYWGETPVAVLRGRSHRYEGYGPERVTFAVRVFHALGARVLFLTNAVGSMNPGILPGSLMLVRDHLDFQGTRGLLLPSELPASLAAPAARPTPVYSPRLQALLRETARREGVVLREGTLLGGLGPAYETAAEIRAARAWGADAACMSTVMEALVGARLGMEVAAVSCVTNLATGLSDTPLTHDEVTEVADRAAVDLERLFAAALARAAG